MQYRRHRIVILHTYDTPRAARRHMINIVEDAIRNLGMDVVNLYGTDEFVPAEAIIVHYDRSVVPAHVESFANRYPRRVNAQARDIRKHTYVDGLLGPDETYDAPVIVKSTLNYGGLPEHSNATRMERAQKKLARMLKLPVAPLINTKADYKIYDTLADVPKHYFGEHHVVQKFMPEKLNGKNVLREYIFLGKLHYENIELSNDLIITEDENISCGSFQPHPRLLEMRQKLNLDYGKLDYTMVNGEPFIFDANKTLGLGEYSDSELFNQDILSMLHEFAMELVRVMLDPNFVAYDLSDLQVAEKEVPERQIQLPAIGRQLATG